MKKIAIMGGTFDPIHLGHLITAQYILETQKFDEILFIPCFISPLKTGVKSSDTIHRLNMLRLALSGNKKFVISEIEINSKEISYTYNTLNKLKTKNNKLNLIIGYDNYVVFDKWFNPEGIFEIANILVLNRKSDSLEIECKHNFKDRFNFLSNPIIEISSTNIRNRVQNNLSIDYMVPKEVNDYIIKNNLYK